MSTETNAPITPAPEKKGGKKGIFLLLMVLLIALNGFFYHQYYQSNKELEETKAAKVELKAEYDALDKELKQTEFRLDTLQQYADNTIMSQKEELSKMKAEIEGLLKKDKLNRNELGYLKKQLNSFKSENKKLLTQVETLTEKVKALEMANDSLNTDLNLTMAEKGRLLDERKVLDKKVELGSLLKPEYVTATGVKYKGNGKEVATTSAKKSEKLKVCFVVPENKVAEPGNKTIYLRLVSPQGSTIAVESQGSGIFVLRESGEQKQYTTKADFNFTGKSQNLCMMWSAGTTQFAKGEYSAMFYQDGYLLSEQKFELD